MRNLFFSIICLLTINICRGQTKQVSIEDQKIKKTIIGFLNWYKVNENKLENSTIITGFNTDTVKKGMIVKINMEAVEKHLTNFNRAGYVSESFLNDLKQIYQNVSDTLVKHPVIDYFGPIVGLEADPIFGFEPEEILDHFKEGKFTKIYWIYDKAIVKFDISRFGQYIFTLTKVNNKWLIDYYGLDRTNIDKMQK
ncbi:hypothetical protein [Pedobacter soli]|uniref:DUF3828 domain-containing protein n=1 Tax=Pedobacter soli TaxID=390242 RepID=A0A1G6XYK0_9SPHI|nr:hypothetical protein [Pedobacter soli]SDD83304.1 hypothetical protein SAMN04488024_10892 [Pedobacter soli]